MSKKSHWIFYNGDDENFGHGAAVEFIDQLYKQHEAGYGFLPFIGAGFSASAGFPVISVIEKYLHRCIARAIHVESGEGDNREPWNPRTDAWPPLVDVEFRNTDWKGAIRKAYEEMEASNVKGPWNIKTPVFHAAFGATAEWRSALLFLSRFTRAAAGPGKLDEANGFTRTHSALSLQSPQQEIIDACFRELGKGTSPSLSHDMLAVLSTLLRIDTIVTTNFDDLLEQAFTVARNPLQVFEVHLGGLLPAWSAISRTRTLVKMNGGRHSLLAGYTLDDTPDAADKQNFLRYLVGQPIAFDSYGHAATAPSLHNQLLVMGVGATETRTCDLIKFACNEIKSLQVFWVCDSVNDVRQIKELAEGLEVGGKRFHILRHQDAGLLLFQMAQTIRKTLPPMGAIFPNLMRLPLPPLTSSVAIEGAGPSMQTQIEGFVTKIKGSFDRLANSTTRLLTVTAKSGVFDVTSACASLFRTINRKNICLWIDLNDIDSTDHLFEVILEAAYLRLGREDWTPVYTSDAEPDALRAMDRRRLEIKHLVDSTNEPWVLFINARETPGANRHKDKGNEEDGWLLEEQKPFLRLLQDLCAQDKVPLSVVLLCRVDPEKDPGRESISQVIQASTELGSSELLLLDGDRSRTDDEKVTHKLIEIFSQTPARQRFLQTLVLMQRPRLLPVIWNVCADPSQGLSDEERDSLLRWMERLGLLRWQEGGVLWMHSRKRDSIREYLRGTKKLPARSSAVGDLAAWQAEDEAEIQRSLADWYVRVLDATGSPSAVYEAVDHLCEAARCRLEQLAVSNISPAKRKEKAKDALLLLRRARTLLWSNAFLLQTQGYALSSCRRLQLIRDSFKQEQIDALQEGERKVLVRAVVDLQIMAVSLRRAIYRDVFELQKAYACHREIRYRFFHPTQIIDWEKLEKRETDKRTKDFIKPSIFNLIRKDDRFKQRPDHVAIEAARWYRWSATLAISSRSMQAAERSLCHAFFWLMRKQTERSYLNAFSSGLPPTLELDRIKKWCTTKKPGHLWSGTRLMESLLLIERCVDLFALRLSTSERAKAFRSITRPEVDVLLAQAYAYCACGIQLADFVGSINNEAHPEFGNEAAYFKARLLAWMSVFLGIEDPLKAQRQNQRPMALLDAAEACLLAESSHRNRVELGHIEMRRAAVRLRQAGAQPLLSNEALPFSQWSQSFSDDLDPITWKQLADRMTKSDAQIVYAKASDALRFLDRAEPILRERRRSVWWATWYINRRLRAISLMMWATVKEEGTPIPFLGLEACASRVETEADALLSLAVRLTRIDSFRLAATIGEYVSCMKALRVRLVLDPTAIRMPHRLCRMNSNLQESIKSLENTERARNTTETGGQTAIAPPDLRSGVRDEEVEDFIARVQTAARSFQVIVARELEAGRWGQLETSALTACGVRAASTSLA